MFQANTRKSTFSQAMAIGEVIYHATVRNVRKSHRNALMGLLINMLQTLILVAVFYIMYAVLGLRRSALRGDFLLYIMSGIFFYMTQIKTMGSVVGSEGPASPMMHHAPMTTFISIMSSALAQLYIQVLSVVVVLYVYHIAFTRITIQDWTSAFGMLLLAWYSGFSIGLVFLAIKPWFPQFAQIGSQIYARANMIASGKMFVANTLPHKMILMFSWNPLFHIIDQARGYVFINYNPHYSNWAYPLILSTVLMMVGFMGESFTRRHASLSWSARH